MKLKTKHKLKIMLVISYMIFIYIFSEYKFPDPSPGDPTIPKISMFPFLHMGEFGLLTILLMLAFYPKIKGYFLIIVSILYGIIDEIHQFFIPYRWFDYKDILYDVIGAILGFIGFYVFVLIYVFIFFNIKWGNKNG